MTLTPEQRRYAAAYAAGVADELAGILEPEDGYQDDALAARGRARGRQALRREAESLLTPVPRSIPQSEIPPRPNAPGPR